MMHLKWKREKETINKEKLIKMDGEEQKFYDIKKFNASYFFFI